MASKSNRRKFFQATGATMAAASLLHVAAATGGGATATPASQIKILGISGSPRKGKTTAAALRIALEAAQATAPDRIVTELIELADFKIDGNLAAGIPLEPGQRDDFPELAERLVRPEVRGIIVGSPVYFGCMTALCKAFLDRCISLRMRKFALANKVGAAVAVGGVRNGGQELTIQAIQAALLCQDMILVGDGRPTAHTGATVWNSGGDDISRDEFGLTTLKNLGRRVAEVALRVAATA